MDLKNQLCSYEQAVKFDKLGVISGAYFSYVSFGPTEIEQGIYQIMPTSELYIGLVFNAYSSSELMEMLPRKIDRNKDLCPDTWNLWIRKTGKPGYLTGYWDDINGGCLVKSNKATPAESLTDVLIWVIENNHVKPEELKL